MLGVDLRDQERNVLVHAMGLHVRENVVPRLRERGFPLLGRVGGQRGEADFGVDVGGGRLERHFGHACRHLAGPMPRRDVAVALAGLRLARRERADLEPGMALQEPDETLPHRSGGAEDGDLAFAHCRQV